MAPRRPHPAPSLAVPALAVYSAVIVALTMLKAFFAIGGLWDSEVHHNRSISLIPLRVHAYADHWFGPVFDYVGNVLLFIPFGLLVYVLLSRTRRPLIRATVAGLAFSVGVEIAQYLFALGYSTIDDLMTNTLGAFLGAGLARIAGPRFFRVWVWLGLLLGAGFAVLVTVGD